MQRSRIDEGYVVLLQYGHINYVEENLYFSISKLQLEPNLEKSGEH